jgi:hypothetical protein
MTSPQAVSRATRAKHAWVRLGWFALALVLLIAAGCATTTSSETKLKPVKGTENEKDGPMYLVGIIEFVNPEQGFVVFKAEQGVDLPTGHALTALDATGALSELTISAERKGPHVTADIKEGFPRAGNLVIYRPKAQGEGATPLQLEKESSRGSSGPQVEWRDEFFVDPDQPAAGAGLPGGGQLQLPVPDPPAMSVPPSRASPGAPDFDDLPLIPLEPVVEPRN